MATTTYNGYAPGERRGWDLSKREQHGPEGHRTVRHEQLRAGHAFQLTAIVVCECGKRFSSKAGPLAAASGHDRHLARL